MSKVFFCDLNKTNPQGSMPAMYPSIKRPKLGGRDTSLTDKSHNTLPQFSSITTKSPLRVTAQNTDPAAKKMLEDKIHSFDPSMQLDTPKDPMKTNAYSNTSNTTGAIGTTNAAATSRAVTDQHKIMNQTMPTTLQPVPSTIIKTEEITFNKSGQWMIKNQPIRSNEEIEEELKDIVPRPTYGYSGS